MKLLITNIRELYQVEYTPRSMVCGKDMAFLPSIRDAYLLMEDEQISAFGEMSSLSPNLVVDKVINATGKIVLPAFCDSHTHIVYAGSREQEFIDKINGLSYEEIARRGGGILNLPNSCTRQPKINFMLRLLSGLMR